MVSNVHTRRVSSNALSAYLTKLYVKRVHLLGLINVRAYYSIFFHFFDIHCSRPRVCIHSIITCQAFPTCAITTYRETQQVGGQQIG